MDERILKWLHDIFRAIIEIEGFLDRQTDFFEYQKNLLLKRGVERNLEIIGEAMNRILQRDTTFEDKIEEARNIVGLRNQIIHAYDGISDENIWAIVTNHLPKLKSQISLLINQKGL